MTKQFYSFPSKLNSNYTFISLLERNDEIETAVSKQLINELYLSKLDHLMMNHFKLCKTTNTIYEKQI